MISSAKEPVKKVEVTVVVPRCTMRQRFRKFASLTAGAMGSPWAFLISLAIVGIWASVGPLYHYSDTWQLVINTSTTIITFLMVFLIQSTQNRDAAAIHLKLDELIRAVHGARTGLVDLQNMTDEELESLQKQFSSLREKLHTKMGADEGREPAEAESKR